MISRWAYEGLAVEQSIDNSLSEKTFQFELEKSQAKWKKDYWLPELKSRMVTLQTPDEHTDKELEDARTILINEIEREDTYWSNLSCESCVKDLKSKEMSDQADFKNINKFLDYLKNNWNEKVNKNTRRINNYIHKVGEANYIAQKKKYTNEALQSFVTNRLESEKVIVHEGRLYQNDDPIYNDPVGVPFFQSHFYAPHKYLFGRKYSTFGVNLVFIWIISILTYIALYFDIIRYMLIASVRLLKRISGNRVGTAK